MCSRLILLVVRLFLTMYEWNHTKYISLCFTLHNSVFVRFLHIYMAVIYSLLFLYCISWYEYTTSFFSIISSNVYLRCFQFGAHTNSCANILQRLSLCSLKHSGVLVKEQSRWVVHYVCLWLLPVMLNWCRVCVRVSVPAHPHRCWLLFVSFTVCKFHSLVGVWVTVWVGFTVLIFLITSLNSFPHLLAFFCEVCLNKSFAHFSGGLSFLLIHRVFFCFTSKDMSLLLYGLQMFYFILCLLILLFFFF